MYLAPDGHEVEIAEAATAFLADAMPIARLHGAGSSDMDAALRGRIGEMGWFALAIPEAQGGSGLSPVEHALFFREVGRQCGPIDLLAQCLAAHIAGDALRDDLVSGRASAALATPDGHQWRLLGSPSADFAIVVAPDMASLLPLADVPTTDRPALDPVNSMRVASSLPAPIATRSDSHVWQFGQLGVAAMLVGIAETALDLITEYAKVRETFGRKIGSWQAVRHACADMAVRCEAARAQLWYAAAAMKEEREDTSVHLGVAKHLANTVALGNADATIQLHGGIGVTDEHDAHLLLKHALLLSRLFGAKRSLLAQLLHVGVED